MINRILQKEIERLNATFSVVVITGPRQSGKTTLCKATFADYHYVNLENLAVRQFVANDPIAFVQQYASGLIVDECQRLPELFSYIQVVVDEHPDSRIILTGSSNFSLMENITQSLAGRAAVLTLLPLSLNELGGATAYGTDDILIRGGYPGVWGDGKNPTDVYSNYYTTYVERDLRQMINIKDLSKFQQFISLLAGNVGCELNAAKLSAETGISAPTVQHWLSLLESSYILFRLPPYFRNIGKRLVKTSKLYFYDTGLACHLLNINTSSQLSPHPLRGALFENLVVSEFMKRYYNHGLRPSLFFYRDNQQKEIDIVEETSYHSLNAYEVKSARTYNTSFGAGLVYFRKLFGTEVQQTSVLYDGTEELIDATIGYRNARRFLAEADRN